ncbi:uncharacterized protein si:dkey-28a3.2 [Labrus mixtus]|uniref:uncharacterized protein si:dkey-28a3.2 n=1 Tax=Labrus mixtus TaxID=508554 RepID=UPI0029C076D3|nr:uncharacterized protein si:dkey-28a3.2 [Labrus mixtus]XP_060887409.1 uncharacterized protein si:dkey-28a3.2 [Labrus mixtus]
MPTAKGKGGATSHRYRPASEYDNATLAHKREYWRTKKREQRARLSESRGKPRQESRGDKLLRPNVSGSFAALASPLQGQDESRNTAEDGSVRASERQKEKWLQTMELNKVLPQVPASYSVSVRAAAGVDSAAVKCPNVRAAGIKAVTSPTAARLNSTSSVPPSRPARITNGSSTKTPQPCVSMQGAFVPKTPPKAQSRVQPKLSPSSVTTGQTFTTCPPSEGNTTNTSPQRGTKSALASSQRAKGVYVCKLTSTESDEERAARRREHWRIKKREQRAKLASRLPKTRERIQGPEVTSQRQTAQKAGLAGVSPRTFPRRVGQNQCHARVNTSFTPAKRLATFNLQADQVKVQNPPGNMTVNAPEGISVRRAGETQRKLPIYVNLSNVSRGIARCKTPRQRFIDAQKTFMNQRNMRCKSPMLASFFGTRNIPKIDPNDTPEQIIAKRREYWRIKKREQRAKLTMEMKARLKEKDCVMRRVKRYQKILEEMRRARAQSAGSILAHASEAIGGFIKEDGTVSVSVPTNHSTADEQHKREQQLLSKSSPISAPHGHPDNKRGAVAPIRVTLPPLRPAQVKVSFPLAGLNKPQRLPSIRAESTSVHIHTVGQLKLTHPQSPESASSGGSAAGSGLGGCVMKMAVSSSVTSPSASCPDPGLTQEERMAKKREYWRIKKREQRAARAARLKQGMLQARALQRRKLQRQATAAPPDRTDTTESAQPLPGNSFPAKPNASGIKQEAAVDLDSPPEQAICPDIKPPTPPSPPPAPQQEPDPALSADSQATTLLAVASMKKLLEESLSTVTECKGEQADVKIEDEASDAEPKLMQLFFEEDQVAPIAADLTLEIKSWQADSDASVQAGSPSLDLKNSPPTSEPPSPLPVSNPTCESSSQTSSNFIVKPAADASDGPPSPRRTQRICAKKTLAQNSPPEPPRLHHLPLDQTQPEQRPRKAPEPCRNRSVQSPQKHGCVVTEHGGLSSLQRKREYWKLMKRQQRARLKAGQRDRAGDSSIRFSQRNTQASGVGVIDSAKGVVPPVKPAPQPRPPTASVTSVTSVTGIPTVLVVSPAAATPERSPDTLQVKVPVNRASCSEQRPFRPSQVGADSLGAPENQRQTATRSGKWICRSTGVDSPPPLPTLKPPENPLTSINLHPIEPPPQALNPTLKIPSAHLQTPAHTVHKLTPISTMVPPKRVLGEPEEDFLRRKREYWRIKKKEQRARKAIREKGVTSRGSSNTWRPILPAQEQHTQDSDPWVNSSEESEHLMSQSDDADPSSFSYPNYTAPLEDESELVFMDYESSGAEDGPVSDAVWRSGYLMDYDPLNQLLVCMVCGEQQYSHSLEGVRAHIDDAHPDTLNLDPGEHQRILEAWDEQVSQRERFFTSQLQRNSETETEGN